MEQRESTEKSDEKRFLLNDPTAEDLKPTPEVQSFYRAQILSTQAAEASAGYTVIAIM